MLGDCLGPTSAAAVPRKFHSLVETSLASSRCIACSLCSFWCPADCLFVGKGIAGGRWPQVSWHIDRRRCVFCGNCTSVCPVLAIAQSSFPGGNPARVLVESLSLTFISGWIFCYLSNSYDYLKWPSLYGVYFEILTSLYPYQKACSTSHSLGKSFFLGHVQNLIPGLAEAQSTTVCQSLVVPVSRLVTVPAEASSHSLGILGKILSSNTSSASSAIVFGILVR